MSPAQALHKHLPLNPGQGEALCIWQQGRQIYSGVSGAAAADTPWEEGTLAPIFSATKPLSAACLLLALHEHGLGPELEIGELWPAFPAPHCTVAHALSHRAGLAALNRPADLFDLDACRAAIEQSAPHPPTPEEPHAYHPHTFGPLVDILMLALCGQRVADFWESRVRRPLGIDAYIGLPEQEQPRVAHVRLPRASEVQLPPTEFNRLYTAPGSPVHRAFHSITGIPSASSMRSLRALQSGCPARGGLASARGLAMAYQALLGALPGSPFPAEVLSRLATPLSTGFDGTLRQQTSFSCGAMCGPGALFPRSSGGQSFGHPGFGGCHAFAQPATGLSFAYIPGILRPGVLPAAPLLSLIAKL